MKEIRRRVMHYEGLKEIEGNPQNEYWVDAEIIVENKNQRMYLHSQWIDQIGEKILFETTEESMFDIYLKMHSYPLNYKEWLSERDRIGISKTVEYFVIGEERIGHTKEEMKHSDYIEYYEQLLDMMQAEVNKEREKFDLYKKYNA